MKIIICLVVLALFVLGLTILTSHQNSSEDRVYQGPVRPTDDLEYFRKTGITKPLEVNK